MALSFLQPTNMKHCSLDYCLLTKIQAIKGNHYTQVRQSLCHETKTYINTQYDRKIANVFGLIRCSTRLAIFQFIRWTIFKQSIREMLI